MNSYTLTLSIVAIIFVAYVMRLWIRAHYGAGPWDRADRVRAEGQATEELLKAAHRLEERIGALEAILDKDLPHWRRKL